MTARARVLLLGPADERLAPLLGPERSAALARELQVRLERWAADVGDVVHAGDRGLQASVAHLFATAGEPVLVAWPELPVWRPEHAQGALDDLADGCEISVGPVFDGGFYLLALARPLPGLFDDAQVDWEGPDALGQAFAAANQAGLTVGMLRAERALRSPADVRALLADPMLDAEMRQLLG